LYRNGSEGEKEEEGDENAAEVKPRDAFVEDPALLRQRREQQWAAQQQQRSARRRGGPSRAGNEQTTVLVVNFSTIND